MARAMLSQVTPSNRLHEYFKANSIFWAERLKGNLLIHYLLFQKIS